MFSDEIKAFANELNVKLDDKLIETAVRQYLSNLKRARKYKVKMCIDPVLHKEELIRQKQKRKEKKEASAKRKRLILMKEIGGSLSK